MSRYFANGTEGHAWTSQWCDQCENDHDMHYPNQTPPGCPILCKAYCDTEAEIPEWVDLTDEMGFTFPPAVHCLSFAPCQSCKPGPDGPPPKPVPVHPDQQAFDLTPAEKVSA